MEIENPTKKDGQDLELNRGYWDMGYFGGKLNEYRTFKKRFWNIEDRSFHFLRERKKFISSSL